jgi:protein ImuA
VKGLDSATELEQNKNKSYADAMAEVSRNERLAALRRRLEALERVGRRETAVLPFGVPALDGALRGGGLAMGALHEVAGAGPDEEGAATVAAFLAGILARLQPPRPVLWCSGTDDLYGPGLADCGLAPERLILTRARNDREALWAMEEGLRSPVLAAVVGEVSALSLAASRRLQLAAEASGVTAFALRRWRSGDAAARQRQAPNAALTRWRVAALPGALAGEPGVGRPLWRVELWRCRGGVPVEWMVEAGDATGHVSLAAALADRPAAAFRPALAG